jgi:hypothetical protein
VSSRSFRRLNESNKSQIHVANHIVCVIHIGIVAMRPVVSDHTNRIMTHRESSPLYDISLLVMLVGQVILLYVAGVFIML